MKFSFVYDRLVREWVTETVDVEANSYEEAIKYIQEAIEDPANDSSLVSAEYQGSKGIIEAHERINDYMPTTLEPTENDGYPTKIILDENYKVLWDNGKERDS